MKLLRCLLGRKPAHVPVVHSARVRKAFVKQQGEARALRERAKAWDDMERLNNQLILLLPEILASERDNHGVGSNEVDVPESSLALVLGDGHMFTNTFSIEGGAVHVLTRDEMARIFGPLDTAMREQGRYLSRVDYRRRPVTKGDGFLRFFSDDVGLERHG